MNKLRSVGRVAIIGIAFLFFAITLAVMNLIDKNPSKKSSILKIYFLWQAIFIIENLGTFYTSNIKEADLRLTKEERAEFEKIQSPFWVYPHLPHHLITIEMNRMIELPQLKMINGYSGKSSQLFAQLSKYPDPFNASFYKEFKESRGEYIIIAMEKLENGKILEEN